MSINLNSRLKVKSSQNDLSVGTESVIWYRGQNYHFCWLYISCADSGVGL